MPLRAALASGLARLPKLEADKEVPRDAVSAIVQQTLPSGQRSSDQMACDPSQHDGHRKLKRFNPVALVLRQPRHLIDPGSQSQHGPNPKDGKQHRSARVRAPVDVALYIGA